MLSDLLKKLLYGSGLLGLYHRLRNRRTLTVIMFHRVLDPRDPRWASCDPDYTLAADLFARCLAFFGQHYHVVGAGQVLAARRGGVALPPRALLITFDDGWADNVEFALPRLKAAGMPGLLFVVADAIDRRLPFYQEQLVSAWRLGRLGNAELQQTMAMVGLASAPLPANDNAGLRRLIGELESLPRAQRERVLANLGDRLDDGHRSMVNGAELERLLQGGVAIGLHGKTHEPLPLADDLDAELGGARAQVAARLPKAAETPVTMSFPHGRYDMDIARRAHAAGYELVFTSVPALNPSGPAPGWLLGRLGFETGAVADPDGAFRPDRLALYLFRRPQRQLA
jgi:peptidoglycan/xylan/chitin deacetylase (PgdA/CDA1 family)